MRSLLSKLGLTPRRKNPAASAKIVYRVAPSSEVGKQLAKDYMGGKLSEAEFKRILQDIMNNSK